MKEITQLVIPGLKRFEQPDRCIIPVKTEEPRRVQPSPIVQPIIPGLEVFLCRK